VARKFSPHVGFFEELSEGKHSSTLGDKFLLPPFTVLNAREGWWQDRKRAWLELGIKSELGRGEGLTYDTPEITEPGLNYYRNKEAGKASPGGSARPAMDYSNRERGSGSGSGSAIPGTEAKKPDALLFSSKSQNRLNEIMGQKSSADKEGEAAEGMIGTSIFDPVLCELAYRWWSPPSGLVLDPFAGGSVRGIVASKLGRRYIGTDLSAPQCGANRKQAEELCTGDDPVPQWIVGDSRDIETLVTEQADFIWTCPPYADLEVYSDDPKDLSQLGYAEFAKVYAAIIKSACARLRQDRFAGIVVGDVRGKDGCYYGFPWDTVAAFKAAGLRLHNEAVLVTAVGSLPIRAGRQFSAGRKLGKTHQNLFVFVKGDPKRASLACGTFEE